MPNSPSGDDDIIIIINRTRNALQAIAGASPTLDKEATEATRYFITEAADFVKEACATAGVEY